MALAGIPRTTVWVDKALKIAREADQWLQSVVTSVDNTAQQIGSVAVTGQHAALAATAIPAPALSAGLYRVNYSLRVTLAASTSSAMTPTIAWISGGVSCSQSGASLTGNTTATQQNASVLMQVDAGTTITYAVTYASVGATSMLFAFSVSLEQLP